MEPTTLAFRTCAHAGVLTAGGLCRVLGTGPHTGKAEHPQVGEVVTFTLSQLRTTARAGTLTFEAGDEWKPFLSQATREAQRAHVWVSLLGPCFCLAGWLF